MYNYKLLQSCVPINESNNSQARCLVQCVSLIECYGHCPRRRAADQDSYNNKHICLNQELYLISTSLVAYDVSDMKQTYCSTRIDLCNLESNFYGRFRGLANYRSLRQSRLICIRLIEMCNNVKYLSPFGRRFWAQKGDVILIIRCNALVDWIESLEADYALKTVLKA